MRTFQTRPLAAAIAAALLPATAAAYTVTNTNDSGTGSLRDAINLANGACPTATTISFAIPGTAPFVIAPLSALPGFFCAAPGFVPVVDGGGVANSSTTGFNATLPIILDGSALTGGCGLTANPTGGGAVFRGLHIRNFIGGGVCGANFTVRGSRLESNGSINVYSNGAGNTIVGGTNPVDRNWIFASSNDGISVVYGGSADIRNNLIGPDAGGTTASSPNAGRGIHIGQLSGSNTISNNIIAGNGSDGIHVQNFSPAGPTLVSGNKVGMTASGAALGNGGTGVKVVGATNVNITQNSIAFNGGRGIHLDNYGGTVPNDFQDGDIGSNSLQNHPLINLVDHVGGNTPVTYYLNSTPGRNFRLEFFSNANPGVSEGRTYSSTTNVTTDANGDATGTFTLPGTLTNISATARDETTLETSEFADSLAFTGVPAVNVAPMTINFGNVGTGTTSPPRSSTLTSTGTGFWVIGQIGRSFGGSPTCYGGPICYGGTEFICSTTCNTAFSYATGTGCTFTAQFAPTSLGMQTERVGFCDNTTAGVQEITLTGIGVVPPELSLLPSFYDFGDVTVSTVSPQANFAIRNTGVLPITVVAYRTGGPFVFEATSCDNPIQPGVACQAQVTFRPTAAGSASGTFLIETATGAPAMSNLAGNGTISPRLALPNSIEFTYTLGSEPTLFQLTLTNSGLADLQFNSIVISGAPFTLQNPCPATLAPGASCVLTLGYSTPVTGQFTGTLTIMSNAGSRAITLNGLTQLKPVPVLEVSPSQMGYGSRAFASVSPDQTVTIRNVGGAAARIDSLITSADFVVLNHNCTTLAPLASCEADIAMRATAYGQRRGTLTITSNADKSPHTVSLFGTSCRTGGMLLGRLGLTSGCAP